MDRPPCDNQSVGAIITDADGHLLMFERNTFPPGIAPCAGHVDDHGSLPDAARAEVAEELGLTVTHLEPVTGGWRANTCRRSPGPRGPGHHWHVYRAEVTGDLRPSARETRNPQWLGPADVKELAARTLNLARGEITHEDFDSRPGLEPVWVRWLAEAGLIYATEAETAAVEPLCTRTPGDALTP